MASGTDTLLRLSWQEQLDLGGNGSVTTGNSVLNNSGLSITGGLSVITAGIDAGKVVSNVKAGDLSRFNRREWQPVVCNQPKCCNQQQQHY